MAETISRYMLKTARQFIINHKRIFKVAIIAFAKVLPEPTIENVGWENGLILLRIREKFFRYCNFEQELYQAAWKIVIDEMVHDPDHRATLQFVLEEIVEAIMNGEWKPRDIGFPGLRYWKEPGNPEGNYGGYNGYSFKQLIKKEGMK